MPHQTPSSLSSIYDLIARAPAQGQLHRLSEPTFLIPAAPRFHFGTFPEQVAGEYFRHVGLGAVGTFRMKGVAFHADYLMARGAEAIICSELNVHPFHVSTAVDAIGRESRPVRRIGGCPAFIFGPGHRVFGHWLSDFLPKLYVLLENGHDLLALRYLVPRNVPAWGLELLRLIGLQPAQYDFFDPDIEIVEIDEILLPTFLHNGVRFAPIFADAIAFIRERVHAAIGDAQPLSGASRIYISRAKASQSRPFLTRQLAETIAQDHGFAIRHPEALSIADQIRLFASATAIVGEYGSAHHLSIFSPPDTVVGGFRGSVYHPGFIQSGIGHALSQPTGYVFGTTDQSDHKGAYLVPEQTIRDCLDTVFKGRPFEPAAPAVRAATPDSRTHGSAPPSSASSSREPIQMGRLWSDFHQHAGRSSLKWKHYFPIYERHFARFVDHPMTMIEIGCGEGGSLQLWKKYFGPHARIIGIDVRDECMAFEEDQVSVRIGNQADEHFLEAVVNEFGPPDIVLDDGSHQMADVNATFRFLYPRTDWRGVYLVEDMHTAYFPDYGGGLRKEGTFIENCKALIDELNATTGGTTVSDFTKSTLSMHFYDSVVVFERGRMTHQHMITPDTT